MRNTKAYTVEQLVEYRNKTLLKARARTRVYQDGNKNYYWYRIKEIDQLLNNSNNYSNLGMIKLKKVTL